MRRSTRRTHLLALSALIGAALLAPDSLRAQRPTDAQLTTRVDEYMQRLESQGFAGGVLIVRDGTPVFTRSYGMANAEAHIRADTATVYNLGSITKQFTAAAILRLEELGTLRTTDSISRFFPDVPADKRDITLHQLLTHTAGFRSDYSPTDYEPTTRDEYVRRMFAAPLRTRPGTTFFYANSGYSLLAAIVEIVTKKDYEAALRNLVLRPAGMLQTGYKLPAWPAARIAHGYQDGRDWGTIADRIAKPGAPYWELRGNGGLQTTLGDIARWDSALNDRRMLTDSSRKKFMTGYVNEGPEGLSQYAYGWAVMQTSRGTRLVTHNGGNGVYVAELLRFVDDKVTVFVTSTVTELTATQAVRVISKVVFDQPYTLPPKRVAASTSALESAKGAYVLNDGSRLILRVENGRLVADAVGQQAFQLLASGDTTSPADAARLNGQSRAIVEALVKHNTAPLIAALGPGTDSADVVKQETELMSSRLERFGAFGSIEVLGTTAGPEGGLRTTVRLNFAKGGATNLYTWGRGGFIMDLGARPFVPTELVPAENGEFRTFDARSGREARLIFTNGTGTAITGTGTITLRRMTSAPNGSPSVSVQPGAYDEPLRPQYHFTPARNWMNDPNGMVWYGGEWHLFYQHNPFGNVWGHMSWGHAVSRDLVHWEQLPVALAEENGVMIFSGSAVVDRNNTSGLCTGHGAGNRDSSCLVAIYTAHTETNQSQHIAYSNDRGRTWTKYARNPVIDIGAKDFRDPKVFWHSATKRWIMVVSLATQHKIRLYGSSDLREWTQLSEFGPAGASNGVWECPDLFELPVEGVPGERRWVLVVNMNPGAPAGGSGAQYFVGRFDGTTFTSDDGATRWADQGKDFYAAVSWNDVPARDGRRVWLGWMSNWEYAVDEPTSPFRTAMTIPRTLSLRRDGKRLVLLQRPVAELQALRTRPQRLSTMQMGDGVDVLAGRGIRGDALELELDVDLGTARELTLAVRRGQDEETLIGYDVARSELFIDRGHSGAVGFSKTFAGRHAAPMNVPGKRLRLRIFIDRSSVELFGNQGASVITDRIFPSPGSTAVTLRASGNGAKLIALNAWTLRSIW